MWEGSDLLTAASKEPVDVEGPLILRARIVEFSGCASPNGVRRCLPMLREKSEGASRYGEEKRRLTLRDTREADTNFVD